MMDNYPVVLTQTKIEHLFATPLIISELPADIAAEINPRLKELILAREKETPSQKASNNGGWQSDDKITAWGGDETGTVVSAICQMLDQITVHFNRTGTYRGGVAWKINGWANINRKNNSNVAHIHPGSFWSAVYYVATDDDEKSGGVFQAFDPRAGLPLMYCPVLRIGLAGYMTAGNSEIHRPREGQCLIFPSWLSHAVTPYTGEGTRISLAFNFSV
ncbi:MAG: TIGR02466 family protein [Alphaproteobacteria bacterium]|nr:TIGR02466 family protein [Alphaproteobacteria bacterium]